MHFIRDVKYNEFAAIMQREAKMQSQKNSNYKICQLENDTTDSHME